MSFTDAATLDTSRPEREQDQEKEEKSFDPQSIISLKFIFCLTS